MMEKWIKKALFFLGVAFVLFFLFTRPEQSAEFVKDFFGLLGSIEVFFRNLAS